jgi:hypothetical protein
MAVKSRRGLAILVVVLVILGWVLLSTGRGKIFSSNAKGWGSSGQFGGVSARGTERETQKLRKREITTTKKVKELSTAELDRYLDVRGVNEASMLFAMLNSGDPKYRGLAIQLPDSPLKFMMLSMDTHDDPKLRLEWSKKLYELDPLNRVSASRYVCQLMDSGDTEKASEVLSAVKNCTHTSNGYDLLINEFEFARNLFGDERFGPMAVIVARTWSVRTAHYTAENYLDSVEYSGVVGRASTAFIHDKAKDYLLDVGYSEESAASEALILTKGFLANFRDEYTDRTDQNLKDRYSKEIKDLQARGDVLFYAGMDRVEKVDKHRSATDDMNYVIENMSKWRSRKMGKE